MHSPLEISHGIIFAAQNSARLRARPLFPGLHLLPLEHRLELFMSAVIAAFGIMLILSLCRALVVIALIVRGWLGGLGGGVTVILSFALLGAFAMAIAKSGLARGAGALARQFRIQIFCCWPAGASAPLQCCGLVWWQDL